MKKSLLAVRLGVALLTCLLLVTFTLSSCGEKAYIAVYPKEYTPYYFYQNYVPCDPNLIHLNAAKNSAGKYKDSGRYFCYYAIKDVPVEEYVCYSKDYAMLDPCFSSYVGRHSSVEISQPEVLTWTVTGADLYWRAGYYFNDTKGKMTALGEKIFCKTEGEVDGAVLQAHLKAAVEEGNYVEHGGGVLWDSVNKRYRNEEGVESELALYIRLHFAEYENIVWDGMVVTVNGQEGYFLCCYVYENFSEGDYDIALVPLPDEIVEKFPLFLK